MAGVRRSAAWAASILAALAAVYMFAASGAPAASSSPRYYLSLGDSLSQGVQPDVNGKSLETNQGYPDQLYATLHRRMHNLVLVKLGCPGESTTSMRTGKGNKFAGASHCHPAGGSQLAAAERFLKAHHKRGEVALVTLDIGANDVDGCAKPGIDTGSCLAAGEKSINDNTPPILKGIKQAAPAGTVLTAMNLYNPLLAGYFSQSSRDQLFAAGSVALAKQVNGDIEKANKNGGFKNVDVAGAFASYDTAPTVTFGGRKIPLNVARVCAWTWACTTPPSGPNIHANKNGYAVIAGTFAKVIGKLR